MATPTGAKIQLVEYQKPALEAGEYTVSARQIFQPTPSDSKTYTATRNFVVSGPRFSLDPGAVRAMYPPVGALGEYSTVLPHISLRTPTLPWERSAYAANDFEPWLVLLVIDEGDVDRGEVVIPGEAKALANLAKDSGFKYSYDPSAKDTDPTEQVSYLKVKQKLLNRLMPDGRAMNLRAHVRRRVEDDGSEREMAVVFADRMPRPGAGSFCFLVSVEGLYNEDGAKTFRYGDPNSDQWVVLCSLASWGFASYPRDGKTFDQLVEDISAGPLVVPAPNANAAAKAHVQVGAAPLWHEMRSSDQSYSWYRGPLSPVRRDPAAGPRTAAEVPEFADSLVTYHHNEAMFDVSEAAAFELGKAMALNDRAFTSALYDWKEAFNHGVLQRLEASVANRILVGAPTGTPGESIGSVQVSPADDERIAYLKEWLAKLAALRPLPFNYLVPDEAMLAPESLRFFDMDNDWVDALLAGAFSVGGMLRTDLVTAEVDAAMLDGLATGVLPPVLSGRLAVTLGVDASTLAGTYDPATKTGTITTGGASYPLAKRANTVVVRDPGVRRRQFDLLTDGASSKAISGVILRSQLVSGWPDMFIEAFAGTTRGTRRRAASLTPLKNLRADRLAPDTLLLCFDGQLQMIEFYLKPEGLHFGLDENLDGTLSKSTDGGDKPVSWRSRDHRTIDLAGLAAAIKPRLNAASFGMEMFEGSAKGRFTIKAGS